MEWLNIFGLIFIVLIMIPNIIYAIKYKDGFINKWQNKTVELLEQVGTPDYFSGDFCAVSYFDFLQKHEIISGKDFRQ